MPVTATVDADARPATPRRSSSPACCPRPTTGSASARTTAATTPAPIAITKSSRPRAVAGSVDACFVATAAYGSLLANDVELLRHFRDIAARDQRARRARRRGLLHVRPAGRGMVGESELLRSTARDALAPIVQSVRRLARCLAPSAGHLNLTPLSTVIRRSCRSPTRASSRRRRRRCHRPGSRATRRRSRRCPSPTSARRAVDDEVAVALHHSAAGIAQVGARAPERGSTVIEHEVAVALHHQRVAAVARATASPGARPWPGSIAPQLVGAGGIPAVSGRPQRASSRA